MEYFTYYVSYQLLVGVLGFEPRFQEPKSCVVTITLYPNNYLILNKLGVWSGSN